MESAPAVLTGWRAPSTKDGQMMSTSSGVEIGFRKASPQSIGSGSAGGISAYALPCTWAAPSADVKTADHSA